jgi:hypothetical protein
MIVQDESLYEAVMEELEKFGPRKGLWAKCFSEADGDEGKAKARYLRIRFEQLKEAAESHSREAFERDKQRQESERRLRELNSAATQLQAKLRPMARTMKLLGLSVEQIATGLRERGLPDRYALELAQSVVASDTYRG